MSHDHERHLTLMVSLHLGEVEMRFDPPASATGHAVSGAHAWISSSTERDSCRVADRRKFMDVLPRLPLSAFCPLESAW